MAQTPKLLGLAMGALLSLGSASTVAAGSSTAAVVVPRSACRLADPDPPEYYEFELVTTRNVPGTGRSSGLGQLTFRPSPFSVSIGSDGSYLYDIVVTGVNLRAPRKGVYVAWAMTPEIDHIERLGALDRNLSVSGQVAWNKFLVAITLESEDNREAPQWTGPIVMRGVSRSGLMHTTAGHGPLELEACAKYGFGN